MTNQLIRSILQEATYKLKAGTITSYYWQSGMQILPNRLSISQGAGISKAAKKGRNLLHPTAGQMKGQFTRKEESPLKQNKPFKLSTQVWAIDEYPLLIGYGSIAISDTEGAINKESDLGDLVVFQTVDNWQTIRIYYAAGMITNLEEVMEYLSTII